MEDIYLDGMKNISFISRCIKMFMEASLLVSIVPHLILLFQLRVAIVFKLPCN